MEFHTILSLLVVLGSTFFISVLAETLGRAQNRHCPAPAKRGQPPKIQLSENDGTAR